MDKITQEDIGPQFTSPLSPKRPKTDYAMTNSHSGKSRFDFPELLTFQKTTNRPSSTSTLTKKECEAVKPPEQLQDTKLIVTLFTKLTASHIDDAHTGSSQVCFIAAERCFLPLVKDEQPPVTATDDLSSHPIDDACGTPAESHTSKDASADTSSHLDCNCLGSQSLEDGPPGGCSLPAGNDEDGRQVQSSVSQIQAFPLSSGGEGVSCQSDCSFEDVLRDRGFCDTQSQSAEVEEIIQKKEEHGFCETMLFSKEKEEGYSLICSADYAVSKSFHSNLGEQPSGNLAEGVKNEELQICETENVAVCDGETKGQVNENDMSKNSLPSKCAEGSIVSRDVVLARNIAIENASLEADSFCGAKGEHAAGKMIAKARSETADHTTETPMPARISQAPAEGDNDAGPFSVIDPAIWSETDREAEEKRCNSKSTAGVELPPSVKVCKMETPQPLCPDIRVPQDVSAPDQTGQFNHQSRTQQCKDEKENLWQPYTETQACSITTNKTHNKTGSEGSCHFKSSPSSSPHRPANPPPAGYGRQESHDTVGHELKEQDQSGCFPASPGHLETREAEYLQTEIARMDEAAGIKEREEMTSFEEEIGADKCEKSEHSLELEEKLLQDNKKHTKDPTQISTGDCISDWTEAKISKYGSKLNINGDLGIIFGCSSDHSYNAVILTEEETAELKERHEEAFVREETDVHGTSEILVQSEEDHQLPSQQREDVTEECISECSDGNMSKSGYKSTLVSQHELENKLSCCSDYQHRDETLMVENSDLLAVVFPPTSDAVVPGPHEFLHSQNADNPTALNCNDRFSPVPSAFTFKDCAPGGFDTFEKMQLSLDDCDEAGLSNSPLLTSLAGQLFQTPQRQLYHCMPEAERDEEVPQEEEKEERFECRTENTAKGFSNSDTSCNELPNFISAANVMALGRPEQQPNCESAYHSYECFQDDFNPKSVSSTVPPESDSLASDVNNSPQFEMKKQFDMVLKELHLFFDISRSEFANDSRASSPEQCSDMKKALEGDTSNCKEHLSSPKLGRHRGTSSDDADEDRSLETCGCDPVVSFTAGSGDGEQEVPLGSHLCQETSVYTAEKHKEPWEMEQNGKMWSPSFACRPFLEHLSHRLPEQPRRLEPLRTCTRPIRVGLSKRAKTKHLHRPHPYR